MLNLEPIKQRLYAPQTAEWLENAPDDIADLITEVQRLQKQRDVFKEHAKLWRNIAYRAAEVGNIEQAISDLCDRDERGEDAG